MNIFTSMFYLNDDKLRDKMVYMKTKNFCVQESSVQFTRNFSFIKAKNAWLLILIGTWVFIITIKAMYII